MWNFKKSCIYISYIFIQNSGQQNIEKPAQLYAFRVIKYKIKQVIYLQIEMRYNI